MQVLLGTVQGATCMYEQISYIITDNAFMQCCYLSAHRQFLRHCCDKFRQTSQERLTFFNHCRVKRSVSKEMLILRGIRVISGPPTDAHVWRREEKIALYFEASTLDRDEWVVSVAIWLLCVLEVSTIMCSYSFFTCTCIYANNNCNPTELDMHNVTFMVYAYAQAYHYIVIRLV